MKSNTISNILIVTSEAFPYGMAGTARITSLSKGFISNGIHTQILSMYKYDEIDDTVENPVEGEYEGIRFKNIFCTARKSPYKIKRIFDEYFKFILIFVICLRIVKKRTLIFYYSWEFLPAISLKIVSRIKHTRLIKEETEHPSVRVSGKSFITRYLFLRFHYNVFDSLFVITQNLANYFKDERGYKKPIYILPMIVDVDLFQKENVSKNNNIVFSGVLDDQKEGVDLIIKGFSMVVAKYPDFCLQLYGKAHSEIQIKKYLNLINELNLNGKVNLYGYRTHNDMIKILHEARILIFARPASIQANYGFSTKLGEYLATGNPVIATETGETGKFLIDGFNIFFCKPNENSIAEKIFEIINNYEYALNVGAKGKICVFDNFNNKNETRKAINYLEQMNLNSYN
ncbi:MAG TPA: glycosyltransferase [Bacteroidales bacterium]|nr:glycosyltransferase [Bacteroidales bacterium]